MKSIEVRRYMYSILIQEDAPLWLQLQSRNAERRPAAFFPQMFIAYQIKRSLRRIGRLTSGVGEMQITYSNPGSSRFDLLHEVSMDWMIHSLIFQEFDL